MPSNLPLYKALGLRVGRFLRRILLLVLAVLLVGSVLRFASYGRQPSQSKTQSQALYLFRHESSASAGDPQAPKQKSLGFWNPGFFNKVLENMNMGSKGSELLPNENPAREKGKEEVVVENAGSSAGENTPKKEEQEKEKKVIEEIYEKKKEEEKEKKEQEEKSEKEREEEERKKQEEGVKKEKGEEERKKEEERLRKETEEEEKKMQEEISKKEKEEEEEEEERKKEEEKAKKEKELAEQQERRRKEEAKKGGKENKNSQEGQKEAKPGQGKGGNQTDPEVLMFYNASSDSMQPVWQEPEFLRGRPRRNLTVVLYNLPAFVTPDLWNDRRYLDRCHVTCHFTSDLSLMPRADAVVFFAVYMPHLQALPPRPPGQIWVLWAHEGPNYVRAEAINHSMWQHQFNWTMTYRLDADIWYPYYYFVKREVPYKTNLTALVAQKTKMAAWTVSNCKAPSQRHLYVRELQKHVSVDVYGKCSGVFMDRKNMSKVLARDYKFYLAFENSLCKDYITEKAFKNMQLGDIVVVVRGGADYSQFMPSHSYIDASKFHSPKELAAYLKQVAAQPEVYKSYFRWKHSYRTTSHPPVCRLCLRLQDPSRYSKTYADVYSWYRQGQCHDTRQDF